MPTTTELTYEQALAIATREVKDPHGQTYLRAMPKAIAMYGKAGEACQIRYALENMRSWKGETARACKAIMRKRADGK